AGAAALRENGPGIGIAFGNQRLGDSVEIRERVALIENAAFGIPTLAFFTSAAHMGNGIDEAAINQAESGTREGCTRAQTVGAVTNNQRRITCRQPHVLAIKDCDRNKFSVERGRAQLLEHIAIAIKPAGRRVLLTQGQRARGYVKIKDALRLQRTAKMKAHGF